MLWFRINCNIVLITCGGMGGCEVDSIYRRVAISMPICWWITSYRDFTSKVARRVSGDNVIVSSMLIRCLESARREGTMARAGLSSPSTSPDSFSFGPETSDATGRME